MYRYFSLSSAVPIIDVQFGHLVAAMAILLLQYGHSFVSGSFSSLCPNLSHAAFIAFTMQNTISAIIRKLTTAVRNFP
mgnify:CR=1 FL=1